MRTKNITSLLLLSLTLLAGCSPFDSSFNELDTTQNPPSDSSSQGASSEASSSQESTSSLPEWVDYVNSGDVKLSLSYENRTFMTDGIEKVTLKTAIDGDTAHFESSDGSVIKARYYGIDTPESTGKVQPYGKGASDFNKEKLLEANENGTIVLTGVTLDDYAAPQHDSTGSRYVSLIWINTEVKDASVDQLVLLNLWIVQEGWSYVRNVSSIPQYSDIFYAAQHQAEDYKLNLFSGEPDPRYNYGGYEDVSIKELWDETIRCMQEPDSTNKYDNVKVRIMGTVVGKSDNTLYIQNYDAESNTYPAINFYYGTGNFSYNLGIYGTYVELYGLCLDSENFGFQLTDGNFNLLSSANNAPSILISAEDNTDEFAPYTYQMKASEIQKEMYDRLYSPIEITDNVVCTRAYANDDNTAYTLYVQDTAGTSLPFEIYIPFKYSYGTSWYERYDTADEFVGKTFKVNRGIYNTYTSSTDTVHWQLNLSESADMTLITEA